jgi:hypothetical protein
MCPLTRLPGYPLRLPCRLLPEISDICECRLERTPDNRLRMEQIRLPSGRVSDRLGQWFSFLHVG